MDESKDRTELLPWEREVAHVLAATGDLRKVSAITGRPVTEIKLLVASELFMNVVDEERYAHVVRATDVIDWSLGLPPEQVRAARLRSRGMKAGDVADEIAVHRHTVAAWELDPVFEKCVRQFEREDAEKERRGRDELDALVGDLGRDAVEVIKKALVDNDVATARAVVKLAMGRKG